MKTYKKDFINIIGDKLDIAIYDYINEHSTTCPICEGNFYTKVIETGKTGKGTIIRKRCCGEGSVVCPDCLIRICVKCGKDLAL